MTYYILAFIISCMLSGFYFMKRMKYSDGSIVLLYTLAPITIGGYYLIAASHNIAEAKIANMMSYLGGCFMSLIVLSTIISMCKIKLPSFVSMIACMASSLLYMAIVTNDMHHLYYRTAILSRSRGISYIVKEYGPLHSLFYVLICSYFLAGIVAVVYGIRKKKEASLNSMIMLLVMLGISIFAFFFGRTVTKIYETTPVACISFQLIILLIELRGELYNYDVLISNAMVERKEIGYIAFDNNLRYLGSDATLKEWFPIVKYLRVDKKINETIQYYKELTDFAKMIDENDGSYEMIVNLDDKIFKLKGSHLMVNHKKQGYSFFVEDDTLVQKEHQRMVYEKEHDAVTGLYNKGKYLELLTGEYRNLDSIALFKLDVMNLEQMNIIYMREQLMAQIADTILSVGGDNKKAFRVGDREIVVVVENRSKEESNMQYYSWLKNVDKLNKLLGDSKVIIACGRAYGEQGYEIEELLREAQQKLDDDKQLLERNRG